MKNEEVLMSHTRINNQRTTSQISLDVMIVTHCAGHILAIARPDQLHWGDEYVSSVHIIMQSCEQFHKLSHLCA